MKPFFKTWTLIVAMLLCSCAVWAQTPERQRLTREQLAEKQASHIAKAVALSAADSTRFVATYCACQKEIWALGPRATQKKAAERTEAETGKALQERFDRSRQLLAIRQKYYEQYSTFLTQKQIQQIYDMERKMMKRLGAKGKRPQRARPRQ